ncbi:MAG: L-threonylcarbamoyladenylate synthase, partial [Methermicoccaceae archaeon]
MTSSISTPLLPYTLFTAHIGHSAKGLKVHGFVCIKHYPSNSITFGVEMEQGGSIRQAVETLRRGCVVAYPTETVYGLGAMLEREPVKRVLALKRR